MYVKNNKISKWNKRLLLVNINIGHYKILLNWFSGLGDEIDPAMMAALMATTALVARGASNEEVRQISQCQPVYIDSINSNRYNLDHSIFEMLRLETAIK